MNRKIELDTRPAIVRVIQDAKCNGGEYREPVERSVWEWPKQTWLARRLAELAKGAE